MDKAVPIGDYGPDRDLAHDTEQAMSQVDDNPISEEAQGKDIISRAEAKARGLTRFNTGKLCKNGHLSERNTKKGTCIACMAEEHREFMAKRNEARVKGEWSPSNEPCKYGHTLRDHSGNCIICRRERKKAYSKTERGKIENAEWQRIHRNRRDGRPIDWKWTPRQPVTTEGVISREEARAKGLKWFFPGTLCKYGHLEEHLVSNGTCRACSYSRSGKIHSRRIKTDIQYRLRAILRRRLLNAVSKEWKSGSAVRDLGCSTEYLKYHLERQFEKGMTWKNMGKKWHIDHIKPLASFDLTDRSQLLEVCNYKNLRPMWKKDNLAKGSMCPIEYTQKFEGKLL